jgi:superfamily II DNA or RNA helicase
MAKINTPDEWAKENRAGFYNWIYTTFHEDQNKSPKNSKGNGKRGCDCSTGSDTEDGSCTAPSDVGMLPHQRFIRDYIQYDSPYRGILLYHGLGTGKSFSSIAAAEGFLGRHGKIVVMIPASLATNYRQEITRFGTLGKPETKKWTLVNFTRNEKEREKVGLNEKFLKKYGNRVWIPNVPSTIPAKMIVKGKNNLVWSALSAEEKESGLDTIGFIIDERYTFVNYNGLTRTNIAQYNEAFFENAFVIIDEAHNFISRVVNGGKYGRRIYENLMEAPGVRLVLLSGTPVINHPFELSLMLNLIRGPMKVYEFQFLKDSRIPTVNDIIGRLSEKQDIYKYIDQISNVVQDGKNVLQISLVPNGFINSSGLALQREDWEDMTRETIMEEVVKIIKSGEKTAGYRIGKRVGVVEKFGLPERKEDFNAMFLDETDPENPRVKNMDLFMRRNIGVISYFRTAGEEYFPTVLPKIIEKIPLANYQFSKYVKVRDEERQMESRKKRNNARAGAGGLLAGKGTVYRAFSRMACNFVFPEDIKRPFPKDLRRALQREIDAVEEDTTEEEETATGDGKGKTKVNEADVQKKYDDAMKKAMTSIETKAQDILTKDKLEQLYSAKLARLLENIENSPGKVLVYSQFRTIEGLGVLKLVLEAAGGVEIKLENKGGSLVIANAEKVLAPVYNGKRFIIFDPDREKTRILLHIYNGEFDKVSKDLQEQLREAGIRDNLRGDAFRTIMITQSGAEGISLKNVRRVMIMEPFWNMVRMDQVIGRAVRTCSHVELPIAERNVEVYIYTSVFTEKQLKDNFTLRRLDLGLTSDSHILQIAEKKDELIQTFLNHLKACAVDCRVHAAVNKPREFGFSCYSFPMPTDPETYSFIPDISHDKLNVLERRKKVQGRVVSVRNKKYVVLDEYPDKLFDYAAYKNAGVLESVNL